MGDINQQLEKEESFGEELTQYQTGLKSKLEAIKESICTQIDKLLESKLEKAADVDQMLREKITTLKTGKLPSKATESLRCDIDTNLDASIEGFTSFFVTSIGNQCNIEYTEGTPARPAEASVVEGAFVWSQELKSERIELSEDGKTVKLMPGNHERPGKVLVDIPMSEGKFSWKIQGDFIFGFNSGDQIGVVKRETGLDTYTGDETDFWGLSPNACYFHCGGKAPEPFMGKMRSSNERGALLEFTLDFDNNGTLGYTCDGKDPCVICDGLEGPLYVCAQLYNQAPTATQFTLLEFE